jgi:hypothetical protein
MALLRLKVILETKAHRVREAREGSLDLLALRVFKGKREILEIEGLKARKGMPETKVLLETKEYQVSEAYKVYLVYKAHKGCRE